MERYRDGKWIFMHASGDIVHVKPGYREEGVAFTHDDFDVIIPMDYQHQLIDFLQQEGMIKPIISNEARSEDLKIIHRLIDVIQKSGRE